MPKTCILAGPNLHGRVPEFADAEGRDRPDELTPRSIECIDRTSDFRGVK